jgi:hypothetical protein
MAMEQSEGRLNPFNLSEKFSAFKGVGQGDIL